MKKVITAALVGGAIVDCLLGAGAASADPPYGRRSTRRRAAQIHEGDPGYSDQLDRDGDGVACD